MKLNQINLIKKMGRKPFMKNSNGYAVDLPERGPGNLRKWFVEAKKKYFFW